MTTLFIFLGLFFGLCLFLRVPAAFAMGIGAAGAFFYNGFPTTQMCQAMYNQLDSAPFIAIPLFVLAGAMYGITGFIEGARIASCSANTGLNYESDAIAACVIGGVSFVGGTGKISGIVIGVFLLQIIFVGLNFLSVDANMLYVIKGLIILVACAIDMRKYLARK